MTACCVAKQTDVCACKPCTYPNGAFVLIVAQCLLILASVLSTWALADCHFVNVTASKVDPFLTTLFNDTASANSDSNTTRGLGFFFWEELDGSECAWDRNHSESSFEDYIDFLGDDWDAPRGLFTASIAFAWIFSLWALLFSCTAQPKVGRYVFATLVIVILSFFQSFSFSVMSSDFCDENECELGSSAKYAAYSVPIFLIAGVLLFFTGDYPGRGNDGRAYATNDSVHDPKADERTAEHHDDMEYQSNRHQPQQHGGHANVQEVPAENFMVDVSLVDSNDAAAAKAQAVVY